MLGKKDIDNQSSIVIKGLLNDCLILPFTNEVKEETIRIKQATSMKVPDAIIAATSIVYGIPLLTADKGFEKISGLNVHILEF